NDRLPGGQALNHTSVDVLELSIAIRMFRTLVGLAVGLPTEAKRRQQPPHAGGADLVAHLAQRGGELVVALRNPEQRTHRIAERRRFHDAPQIFDQRRVLARQRSTTAAGLTNAARRKRPAIELLQATPERRARVSGDLRDGLQPSPPGRAYLPRREQSSPPLVELRADVVPAAANRLRIDHAQRHNALGQASESPHQAKSPKRANRTIDSIVPAGVLRRRSRGSGASRSCTNLGLRDASPQYTVSPY